MPPLVVDAMLIYLDLEGTVITDWWDNTLINIVPIREFLHIAGATHVGIFSFAIGDNKDIDTFKKTTRLALEQVLGVKVLDDEIITCDMMFANSKKLRAGVHYENWVDYLHSVGKEGAFSDWCRLKRNGKNSILVDDVVPHMATQYFDETGTITTTIQTVPVWRVIKVANML